MIFGVQKIRVFDSLRADFGPVSGPELNIAPHVVPSRPVPWNTNLVPTGRDGTGPVPDLRP